MIRSQLPIELIFYQNWTKEEFLLFTFFAGTFVGRSNNGFVQNSVYMYKSTIFASDFENSIIIVH